MEPEERVARFTSFHYRTRPDTVDVLVVAYKLMLLLKEEQDGRKNKME